MSSKISALPDASTLGGTEQIAGVQSGNNVKLTPNQLRTYLDTRYWKTSGLVQLLGVTAVNGEDGEGVIISQTDSGGKVITFTLIDGEAVFYAGTGDTDVPIPGIRIIGYSTDVPVAGFGVSIPFVVDTVGDSGNEETAGIIECVAESLTADAESFSFDVKLMSGGAPAASAVRVYSTGQVDIGLGLAGATRIIQALGTDTDVSFEFITQGAGVFRVISTNLSIGNNTFQLAAGTSIVSNQTTNAQITSNQNNYNIGTGTSFRLESDASRNITGITGGVDGKLLIIRNFGAFDIVFTNEDANSSAANRIASSTGGNITVAPKGSITLQYDTTDDRWFDIAVR